MIFNYVQLISLKFGFISFLHDGLVSLNVDFKISLACNFLIYPMFKTNACPV